MKKIILTMAVLALFCTAVLVGCGKVPETEETPADTGNMENVPDSGDSAEEETDVPVPELPAANLYVVGDSMSCIHTDPNSFYPRIGYGTQLKFFLDKKMKIQNLALAGRSSKSFLSEENYETLKNSLGEGDYLLIAFGHNDEKDDDPVRFTDASKVYTDPSSIGYYLYEYYIKLARDAGAVPILCTPIVRANSNNDYTGSCGHITSNGDYRQAILDVGAAYDVPVVDLTAVTRARYEELGYEKAILYHAADKGTYAADGVTVQADTSTTDTTHLNVYGARYAAYQVVLALREVEGIRAYILPDIAEPGIELIESYHSPKRLQ